MALTAFVAAGIAKSSPMKTACVATKLGVAGFIVPFMFVFDPSILLQGTPVAIVLGLVRCTVVVLSVAVMIGGFWAGRKMPLLLRLLILAADVLIFLPYSILDIPAYIVLAACFCYQTAVVPRRPGKLA